MSKLREEFKLHFLEFIIIVHIKSFTWKTCQHWQIILHHQLGNNSHQMKAIKPFFCWGCSTEGRACLQCGDCSDVAPLRVHWSDGGRGRGQPLLKRGQDNVRSRAGLEQGSPGPGQCSPLCDSVLCRDFIIRDTGRQSQENFIGQTTNRKMYTNKRRMDALHSFFSFLKPGSRKCNGDLLFQLRYLTTAARWAGLAQLPGGLSVWFNQSEKLSHWDLLPAKKSACNRFLLIQLRRFRCCGCFANKCYNFPPFYFPTHTVLNHFTKTGSSGD